MRFQKPLDAKLKIYWRKNSYCTGNRTVKYNITEKELENLRFESKVFNLSSDEHTILHWLAKIALKLAKAVN